MKKMLKVLLLLSMAISLSGCFADQRVSTESGDGFRRNDFNVVDKNSGVNLVLENMEKALEEIKTFEVTVVYDDGSNDSYYEAEVKVILGETRQDISLIGTTIVKDKRVTIYIKDGVINFSYPFSSLNGGVRDTLDNFVKEIPELSSELKMGNVTISEIEAEVIKTNFAGVDLIKNLEDFEVSFKKENNTYTLFAIKNEETLIIKLDEYFRIVNLESSKNGKIITLSFEYPTGVVELIFPANLKGITYFSIESALRIAKAKSLADLIK